MKQISIMSLVAVLLFFSTGCAAPEKKPVSQEKSAPSITKNIVYPYDEPENKPLEVAGIAPILIREETDAYHVAGYYPKTANAEINSTLQQFVQKSLADFKKGGSIYGIANTSTTARVPQKDISFVPFQFITYSIPYASTHTLSILFTLEEFTGGNHPGYIFVSKNFDLKTGKELSLNDIFSNTPQALKKISLAALQEITEDHPPADKTFAQVQRDGTAPIADNYRTFTITSSSINFQFQPYQTGAWSDGAPEVEIPFSTLSKMLKPEFKK